MIPQRVAILLKQPIAYLENSGFGTRAQNALERAGIYTIGEVLHKTKAELFEIPGYDVATHRQLFRALEDVGISKTIPIHSVHTSALSGEVKMELFDHKKFIDGTARITEAIKQVEGSVKLGMTVEGQVHPQSLINVLMGMKESQLQLQQQLAITTSLIKSLMSRLDDSEVENILDDFLVDIDAKVTHLEELKKKREVVDRQPKIVIPKGGPAV